MSHPGLLIRDHYKSCLTNLEVTFPPAGSSFDFFWFDFFFSTSIWSAQRGGAAGRRHPEAHQQIRCRSRRIWLQEPPDPAEIRALLHCSDSDKLELSYSINENGRGN